MFFRIDPAILDRCRQNPSFCEDVLIGDEEGCAEAFDVDQAWEAIHFLISDNRAFADQGVLDECLIFDYAITGEAPVHRRLDAGHGPATCSHPDTVRQISRALLPLTRNHLHDRFDPEAMDAAEVYPENWTREGQESWDYLWHHFERLRDFYQRAAAEGQAVITWLLPREHPTASRPAGA